MSKKCMRIYSLCSFIIIYTYRKIYILVVPEYIMVQKIKCPDCDSKEIIKWCKRKTQNRGLIQRYKCKSCNFYFTLNDGFYRMRNNPTKITQSIDLFYRGVSTRKVQEHLGVFYPHNASNVSIYHWVVKYSKMISKFTNKLKRYNVFHNRVVVSAEEGNFNHPIERLHNSVRARTKTFRSFHGSINSANAIMKGYEIYYNFITKHQAIKCCPYELAMPELKEELKDVKNKWLELIYRSKA